MLGEKGRMVAWNSRKKSCLNGHELAGDNLYINAGKRHCKTCRREWKRKARLDGRLK